MRFVFGVSGGEFAGKEVDGTFQLLFVYTDPKEFNDILKELIDRSGRRGPDRLPEAEYRILVGPMPYGRGTSVVTVTRHPSEM